MAQILIQEVLKLSALWTMKSRYGKRSKYFYLIRKRGQTSSYMPPFGFILSILAFQKQQQE
jgi:hypothetical protein